VPSDLIVYYRPGRPFAAKLRAKLKVARMPYSAVTFGQDATADEAVRRHSGCRDVLVTTILPLPVAISSYPLGRRMYGQRRGHFADRVSR
jgi:hypothetical protein